MRMFDVSAEENPIPLKDAVEQFQSIIWSFGQKSGWYHWWMIRLH